MPSLFDQLPAPAAEEAFTALLDRPDIRIERIVSHGHASADGFWYDQEHGEWVLLVRGGATNRLEGPNQDVTLRPGDYLWLAPRRRHRVDSTEPGTVWLAVHILSAAAAETAK